MDLNGPFYNILMINYKNGKIYKLVNDDLGLTYYGSTCSELKKRLYNHKNNLNCSSKELFKSGNVKIYLVEDFPTTDKIHLLQRERYYIENNNCVNKKKPISTIHDINDYKKKYNERYNKKNKLINCYLYELFIKDNIDDYFNNDEYKIQKKTGFIFIESSLFFDKFSNYLLLKSSLVTSFEKFKRSLNKYNISYKKIKISGKIKTFFIINPNIINQNNLKKRTKSRE